MKAVVLFSGGLDSLLAARLIKDAGIKLCALNFVSPFCQCNRKDGCSAIVQLKMAGLDYKLIHIKEDYLKIVESPKFGRGSNMNPCIDCRILMFKKAKEVMSEIGASFIITGEVVGQRPMSQHRRQLNLIEKETDLAGLILRPLSAKLLPQTIPEKEGWVKREILLDFEGRRRTPQIKMAEQLNIKDYPCPSGGCLLTDSGFSRRIKDLIKHSEFTLDNVELLKIGRHFRLTDRLKLVVGRNEKENDSLESLVRFGDVCFAPHNTNGPTALARGLNGEKSMNDLCVSIVARYSDKLDSQVLEIERKDLLQDKSTVMNKAPIEERELLKLMI